MNQQVSLRVARARTALVLDQPFFGMLALRLRMVEDVSISTMCTDGKQIRYNPDFTSKLSDAEIQGVLAHEVLHCSNGHVWRREGRDPRKWNIAADYCINPIVESAGMQLPSCALKDPQFQGMSSEQIYKMLPTENDGDGGKGQSGFGQFEDAKDEGEAQAEWTVATVQACKVAQQAGKLPAALKRLMDELLSSVVDWKSILRRFVQITSARNDYSWSRPSARYAASGMYLPHIRGEQTPKIAIAIDTSGSIDGEALRQFISEMNSISDECKPEEIVLMYCDAEIQGVETFQQGDQIVCDPIGGGGTDFRPVFFELAKRGETPACLLYFTDLQGTFPETPPGYPVLWVSTGGAVEVPFGEVVELAV